VGGVGRADPDGERCLFLPSLVIYDPSKLLSWSLSRHMPGSLVTHSADSEPRFEGGLLSKTYFLHSRGEPFRSMQSLLYSTSDDFFSLPLNLTAVITIPAVAI
jgi:hypothetical protein